MPDSKAMEVAMLKDLRQDANLAKRRYMELCRQGRVFDARNRIIGVRHRGRRGASAWKERLYRSTRFGWVDLNSLTPPAVSQREPVGEWRQGLLSPYFAQFSILPADKVDKASPSWVEEVGDLAESTT